MEYIWFSIYVKLDYLTYINLLKAFKNAEDIYVASQDKDKFLKILRLNNININYATFSNLVNQNFKIESKQLFLKLLNKKIKLINISSKYYPKQLKNVFNPPLVLFAYGNITLLKNKLVYVYNSNNFSNEGKKTYNEFCEYMNKNNITIVSEVENEYSKVIYLPYIKKVYREDILVISDKLDKDSYINYDNIMGICDYLFIIESSYNIKIAMIVDLMLEQGKDILVVPGSMYNKEAYFSNYLIKDGANCITSKLDLLHYFS